MRRRRPVAWAQRGVDSTAALLRRLAVLLRLTRARLPLAVALALAFGLMMIAALGSVLGLSFYARRRIGGHRHGTWPITGIRSGDDAVIGIEEPVSA